MAAPVNPCAIPPLPSRLAVVDLDVGAPLETLRGHDGYGAAWVLVRLDGRPLGVIHVPLCAGEALPTGLREALRAQLGLTFQEDVPHLATSMRQCESHHQHAGSWPRLTVAVCTRDRPDDLAQCLHALGALDYPDLEILVVDNAPSDGATNQICRERPGVTYVLEPRPGLNWARNRAVIEASGEILAFTDDDVLVDPDWARAITHPFLQHPLPDVVAGMTVPVELDTPAQVAFECYGGLSGGIAPLELHGEMHWGARGFWHYVLVALHGSGANMAFRAEVFDRIGLFDPALDVGTPSNGGGDTEMFFRVMAEGGRFRYETRAIVRHRHRRDFDALTRQIGGWGSGVFAFLTRSAVAYPAAAWVLALVGLRALALGAAGVVTKRGVMRRLALAEFRGALCGPMRYVQGRRQAQAVKRQFGPQQPSLRPSSTEA
jgi:O-antigen biosynthesis protein